MRTIAITLSEYNATDVNRSKMMAERTEKFERLHHLLWAAKNFPGKNTRSHKADAERLSQHLETFTKEEFKLYLQWAA